MTFYWMDIQPASINCVMMVCISYRMLKNYKQIEAWCSIHFHLKIQHHAYNTTFKRLLQMFIGSDSLLLRPMPAMKKVHEGESNGHVPWRLRQTFRTFSHFILYIAYRDINSATIGVWNYFASSTYCSFLYYLRVIKSEHFLLSVHFFYSSFSACCPR